jgi:hypothetical protein
MTAVSGCARAFSQWTSFSAPDPSGVQYATMVNALRRVLAEERWSDARTWVWVDYISIPQRSRGMQKLAINSLSAYASAAHAFVIVAPSVVHADTGKMCNVETYNRRMWCRAENLCHSLRNGIGAMWLASDEHSCEKLSEDLAFMESNLRVMQARPADLTWLGLSWLVTWLDLA